MSRLAALVTLTRVSVPIPVPWDGHLPHCSAIPDGLPLVPLISSSVIVVVVAVVVVEVVVVGIVVVVIVVAIVAVTKVPLILVEISKVPIWLLLLVSSVVSKLLSVPLKSSPIYTSTHRCSGCYTSLSLHLTPVPFNDESSIQYLCLRRKFERDQIRTDIILETSFEHPGLPAFIIKQVWGKT